MSINEHDQDENEGGISAGEAAVAALNAIGTGDVDPHNGLVMATGANAYAQLEVAAGLMAIAGAIHQGAVIIGRALVQAVRESKQAPAPYSPPSGLAVAGRDF